ncbi:MAG: substrate-binding periplasmic protein [Promethearchaeota archaeon]|jgi:ABC-type amino acid transport substrate-binding protein
MNALLIVVCLVATPPEREPYRIGVAHFPPMIVVDKAGAVAGSDYDMFEFLVDDPDIAWEQDNYEYVVAQNFDALMHMAENSEVDIAINGISITHDRLQIMGFSQPYKNSGQRIMTPPRDDSVSAWAYVSKFMRLEILFALFAFVVNCLIWGALLWVVERTFGRKAQEPATPAPQPNLQQEVSLSEEHPNINNLEQGALAAFDAGTTIGYGRFYPVTRLGQIVVVAAFFCGAIVVGDVISTLTTNKIVSRLEGEINTPEDLKGKIVAVVEGTTSKEVVEQHSPAQLMLCEDFYKAVVEMRLGNVEAVVADDPVILNYVKENPTHGSVAGSKFHPEDYGIAFAPEIDPELIKKFSIAIARLRESGKLDLIERQWYKGTNDG